MDNVIHKPVMLNEAINNMNLANAKLAIDCTLGLGGHAEAILENSKARLIGIEQDQAALDLAGERLSKYQGRLDLVHDNFRNLRDILKRLNAENPDAILMDLGMSSFQLEAQGRGFSFKSDDQLDMRMDPGIEISSYKVINKFDEAELADIFWKFGEERFSRRIARAIVRQRKEKPIETAKELADVIIGCLPYKYQRAKIHPATRVFQALRIYVNDELSALQEGLEAAINNLAVNGRICVISYHSLEDRIVKNYFKKCQADGGLKILTKKPLTPSDDEIADNPRSRSAKMRVAMKEKIIPEAN